MFLSDLYKMPHIIYIIMNVIISALFILFVVKSPSKRRNLIIKISGIILLLLVIINRISITVYDNAIAHKDDASILELLPNSICGLSSLLLALGIVFGAKDNFVLNSVSYIGFFGSIIVIFYPDFLITQPFWSIRSITGLLHHSLFNLIVIVMMISGYIKPCVVKFKYLIIMMSFYMTYGIFLIDACGIQHAMQIGKPLIQNAPIITSWYVVFLATAVVVLIYEAIFDFLNKKSNLSK